LIDTIGSGNHLIQRIVIMIMNDVPV